MISHAFVPQRCTGAAIMLPVALFHSLALSLCNADRLRLRFFRCPGHDRSSGRAGCDSIYREDASEGQ